MLREQALREKLETNGLVASLRQRALDRGFGKTPHNLTYAVSYIIRELARDDTAYDAAAQDYYGPEEYLLLADIYLTRLEEMGGQYMGNLTLVSSGKA